jgi:hypothetical protein
MTGLIAAPSASGTISFRSALIRHTEPSSYRRITAARNSPNAVHVTASWIQLIVK